MKSYTNVAAAVKVNFLSIHLCNLTHKIAVYLVLVCCEKEMRGIKGTTLPLLSLENRERERMILSFMTKECLHDKNRRVREAAAAGSQLKPAKECFQHACLQKTDLA